MPTAMPTLTWGAEEEDAAGQCGTQQIEQPYTTQQIEQPYTAQIEQPYTAAPDDEYVPNEGGEADAAVAPLPFGDAGGAGGAAADGADAAAARLTRGRPSPP